MLTKKSLFSVESIELEKIYKVMDLRLSHGYSAYELSFLLGRRNSYVQNAENPLHTLTYSVNEINYLRMVFNCRLGKIMPAKVEPVTYSIKIDNGLNESRQPVYKIERQLPNGKFDLFRTVIIEHKEIELPVEGQVASVHQVNSYVARLFNKGYFKEPKTALMVFKDCQKKLSGVVRPLYLAYALRNFTGKRKPPRLLKNGNEFGRMVYWED